MISLARFFSSISRALDLIAVEYRFGLNGFQTERPVDMPKFLHALGGLILQAQIFIQPGDSETASGVRSISIQPGGHAVIGKFGMIADPRPVDLGILKRSICVDYHFNDNGQAILIEIQGGKVGGKFFRQHWEYLGSGIDRGGIVARMFVDG